MEKELLDPGKRGEKRMLLVPAVSLKAGMGHLKRTLFLLDELGDQTYLYIPAESPITDELQIMLKRKKNIIRYLDRKDKWAIVIFDKRKTCKKEFMDYLISGTLVGLDEGGTYRKHFPYLVDTFLNPLQKIKPNISLTFCHNTGTIKKENNSFKKVLLTFGGEDFHHLSFTLAYTLLRKKIFHPGELTIVQGPLFRQYQWPEGVKIIKNPPAVAELIPAYDLVFTHFGMTCFETVSKGVPVILFNPTLYHQKLGNFYHFPHIGIRKPRIGRLKRILSHTEILGESIYRVNSSAQKHLTITELIQMINPGGNPDCPVCGRTQNRVIQRFPYKTYFICRSCLIIYSQGFKNKMEKYDRNYFFSEYKKQYGKTYIEDFETIKEFAFKRLAFIKGIKGEKKSLLDIGCAYGAFLAAAKEQGYIPEGIDISADASRYVNDKLNIQCKCLDFSGLTDKEMGNKEYDIVTMWYVLEHLMQTDIILKKINRYMKIGGVFAFSTPNTSGISFKKNRNKYLENNPDDHYTLWNPAAAGKVLKLYGFKIVKIRITGHHPERFPIVGREVVKNKKDIFFSFLFLICRIFNLGDTFEVYARKVEHLRCTKQ